MEGIILIKNIQIDDISYDIAAKYDIDNNIINETYATKEEVEQRIADFITAEDTPALTEEEINAICDFDGSPEGNIIPIASKTTLGCVIAGNGININKNGVISVSSSSSSDIDLNLPSDEDVLLMFAEIDLVQPVADANGDVLINTDNKVFIF